MRISFKVVSCVAFCALLVTMASQAHATLLTGTSVTGSLTFGASANLFDPATGVFGTSVPSADLNHAGTTVTIDPVATEFGATIFGADDTADFTDNTLTVTQIFAVGGSGAVYTFTDSAFAGLTLTETSSSFSQLTDSLVGDTLTVSAPGVELGSVAFTFTPAAVPEPTTFLLGCMGIPALLGWAVWKKRKSTAV